MTRSSADAEIMKTVHLRRPNIWIPEIEYCQKMPSHAQIGPQGAEKQLSKVNVVVGGGWVGVQGKDQD